MDRKDEDGASIVGSAGQHAANALPQRAWSSSGVKVWGLVGGVNHCSLHCRLTKFRGLMYRVKYGAVIGREMRLFVCAQLQFLDWALLSQSQRRI